MKFIIENLETNAFKNLNLKINTPGLYGVIGRNGAGKSTLFTAISGEMLYKGTIRFEDAKFFGRISYVPNLDIFDNNLTANDYIKELKGEEYDRAQKYMGIFQASNFFGKKIKKYSLGMKEILAFIYSVSLQSDFIIVDELMNGLDNTMRKEAFKILNELAKTKIILLTSHILEEVEVNCSEIFFLSDTGFLTVNSLSEAKKLIFESDVFSN